MSFGAITAEIYDYTLAHLGDITEVISAQCSNPKHKIGTGRMVVPIKATNADLLEDGRIVYLYQESLIALTDQVDIGVFIVDDLRTRVTAGGTLLNLSGPAFLHELTYRTIGENVIDNGPSWPSFSNDIRQILAYDSNWSASIAGGLDGTQTGTYIVGAGESVFDALVLAAEQSGEFFYHIGNFPSRAIQWAATSNNSGITLIAPTDPITYERNTSYGIITALTQEDHGRDVLTRLFAYGAGLGGDQLKLADAEGLVTVPSGYTVNWASSLITNTDLEATGHPIIERTKKFSTIRPEDDTATTDAAIALFNAAINHIQDRNQAQVYYRVTAVLHAELKPSETVHLTYAEYDGATAVIDIDSDFVIHEVSHSVGRDGVRYTTLLLSNSFAEPKNNGDRMVMRKLKELDQRTNHVSAPSTGTGTTTPIQHHDLLGLTDDDHPQYLRADGGTQLVGNLPVGSGYTIDGVDISVHAAAYEAHIIDADAHHNAVTLADGSDPILTLNGQELRLGDVTTQAEFAAKVNQDLRTNASPTFVDLTLTGGLLLRDRTTSTLYRLFVDSGKVYLETVS